MITNDEKWYCATAVGSNYEQEVDVKSGRWRHRLMTSPRYGDTPWIEGMAPFRHPEELEGDPSS